MQYTTEINHMCPLTRGPHHSNAPVPIEGRYLNVTETAHISGVSHGVGTCAPQQGAAKLTVNVKHGVIEECLIETVGCSGMTHSAAMAAEILTGKTLLEAMNTDLVCDAINVAMGELFLQMAYGRSQTAFSLDGLPVGACLEDLGKEMRSQVGTSYGSKAKGVRYLELAEGYVTRLALDVNKEVIGYQYVQIGAMMALIAKGVDAQQAMSQSTNVYGRYDEADSYINPRQA